jgi:proteasome-associated ATPase
MPNRTDYPLDALVDAETHQDENEQGRPYEPGEPPRAAIIETTQGPFNDFEAPEQELGVNEQGHIADEAHTAEDWTELRAKLEEAASVIEVLKGKLEGICSPPGVYGVVLDVCEADEPTVETLMDRKVQARAEAPHGGRFGHIREVTEEEGAFLVLVQFEDNPAQYYKYIFDVQVVPVEWNTGHLIISTGTSGNAQKHKVPYPTWLEGETFAPADVVLLLEQNKAVIEKVTDIPTGGDIRSIRSILDNGFCEVDVDGSTRMVYSGSFENLKAGERVVLDDSGMLVIGNLGRRDDRWSLDTDTNVSWDDIGGLEECKQVLQEAVEHPLLHKDLYTKYGKKPIKGVLLYGAPGCGKTMLGKAAATSVAALHNREKGAFLYIKGPELLNKWVGETESQIRSIFASARQYKEEHGVAPVVFIDEADAILSKRGSGISSDMEKTMVPMFLAEMDGLDDAAALVILATNRSDKLDSAVVRDGRVDRKLKITRPTQLSTTEIFTLNLDKIPIAGKQSIKDLAAFGAQELFSDKRVLYQMQTQSDKVHDIKLSHAVNGGMIVNIVDQATTSAIGRELRGGKASGITKADIAAAVNSVYQQNADLDHKELIQEVADNLNETVKAVRPMLRG